MDDQLLFEGFHAAYDFEPRAGSFERLRAVVTNSSVRPQRRFAIDWPLPRISLAVIAAVVAVVVVVAAVGGFLVVHDVLRRVVPAGSRGTIVIGSDDTTAGPGLPIQLGEAFAIARVGSVRGYALKFVTYDNTVQGAPDADRGVANVQTMLGDPRLLGMIGPFDAADAWAEMRAANAASLAMISPVNTYTCLTAGPPCTGDGRPAVNTYFRIAARDSLSGPTMADYAYDRLGLRAIAAWDDEDASSLSAVGGFAAEFQRKGGSIVSRHDYFVCGTLDQCPPGGSVGAPDFRPWLRQAKAAGAEAIYAAALGWACAARGQSQGIFDPSSYYLGAGNLQEVGDVEDGLADDHCWADAGSMANDRIYATVGVGAAQLNRNAQSVIAAYKAAHPDPSATSFGTFAGYDSAMILIDAIGRALDANGGRMPSRQQVLEQVAQTKKFHGLTGTFTFDPAGDPVMPTIQMDQNVAGAWTPIANLVVSSNAAQ
jgi:branched-chain amino acid transport system substrate-binding protein